MSAIIKTEAIVLSKLNYGDTSSIVSLYTKDFGRLSVIIKGGRNPKSKMGMIADPINHLQVIIYNKATRDLQLLSSADSISHFAGIKEDFDKLKFAQAVLELVKKTIPEHEPNHRVFKGVIRILELLDKSAEPPIILFGRFFMFFIKELGYEIQLKSCYNCGKTNLRRQELSYNFELGILCSECRNEFLESFRIPAELFEYLICLKTNESPDVNNVTSFERAIVFMEKFLIYHVSDFKGIQTFQIFKENN